MRCDPVGAFGDEYVDLDTFRYLRRDQMSVDLSRVVASEEDLEAGNFYNEHGSPERVSCRVGCESYGGYSVCRIVVYSFNLRKCGEVIGFGVKLGLPLSRRRSVPKFALISTY